MAKFFRMTDKMERGRTLATASNRTQKKREHISALQKRDLREKLEREIKNVIAKPSSERTREEAKLLDAHKEKVSSLLKQMEKSVHRKRLLEEKAEEKERVELNGETWDETTGEVTERAQAAKIRSSK